MKKTTDPKLPRKRKAKTNPISKTIYREHQFMRRLHRYTNGERVFLRIFDRFDINALEDLPNEFFANAEGHTACKVTVDWLGVRAGVKSSIEQLDRATSSQLAVTLSELKTYRSAAAVFYVLEFLPEVVDSAIAKLYLEALAKIPADLDRTYARPLVEELGKMDYAARVRRLGIHEGPKRRFKHRSQYESALEKAMDDLLTEGRDVTQETVAEKLSRESEDSLEARNIRRWNKEFGVDWIALVKQAIKADKS